MVDGLAHFLLQEDYEAAAQILPGGAGGARLEHDAGREVLNILLGNTYLRLAGQAAWSCDRQGVLDQVARATAQFEEAEEVTQGAYFRPYSGLAPLPSFSKRGGVRRKRRLRDATGDNPTTLRPGHAQQSLDYIQKANETGTCGRQNPSCIRGCA